MKKVRQTLNKPGKFGDDLKPTLLILLLHRKITSLGKR